MGKGSLISGENGYLSFSVQRFGHLLGSFHAKIVVVGTVEPKCSCLISGLGVNDKNGDSLVCRFLQSITDSL